MSVQGVGSNYPICKVSRECLLGRLTTQRPGTVLRLTVASLMIACGGGGGGGGDGNSATVTLSWNPVADPDLAGYRIYFGTASRMYSQPGGGGVNVGDVTTHTVMGLKNGTTYYFAVTAYDWVNNESDLSDEAVKAVP